MTCDEDGGSWRIMGCSVNSDISRRLLRVNILPMLKNAGFIEVLVASSADGSNCRWQLADLTLRCFCTLTLAASYIMRLSTNAEMDMASRYSHLPL